MTYKALGEVLDHNQCTRAIRYSAVISWGNFMISIVSDIFPHINFCTVFCAVYWHPKLNTSNPFLWAHKPGFKGLKMGRLPGFSGTRVAFPRNRNYINTLSMHRQCCTKIFTETSGSHMTISTSQYLPHGSNAIRGLVLFDSFCDFGTIWIQSVYTAGTGMGFLATGKPSLRVYIKVPYAVPFALQVCRLWV